MKYLLLLILAFLVACSSNIEQKKETVIVDSTKQIVVKDTKEKPLVKDSVSIQTKLYKDLSYSYNYKLTYKTCWLNNQTDSTFRFIEILDKKTNKRIDSIGLQIPAFMAYGEDINETRSYITAKNKNKEMVNNYAGDFVVADLNFDGREDFALPNNTGVSVGPYSIFFVQDKNGKFVLDSFLTDSVEFFPNKIFPEKRMLLTLVHAGACCAGEHKYVINKKGEWHQVSHRILGAE